MHPSSIQSGRRRQRALRKRLPALSGRSWHPWDSGDALHDDDAIDNDQEEDSQPAILCCGLRSLPVWVGEPAADGTEQNGRGRTRDIDVDKVGRPWTEVGGGGEVTGHGR